MVRVRVRVGVRVRVRVMVRGRGRVCILNLSNLIKVAMTSLVSCTRDSYPLNDHQCNGQWSCTAYWIMKSRRVRWPQKYTLSITI